MENVRQRQIRVDVALLKMQRAQQIVFGARQKTPARMKNTACAPRRGFVGGVLHPVVEIMSGLGQAALPGERLDQSDPRRGMTGILSHQKTKRGFGFTPAGTLRINFG